MSLVATQLHQLGGGGGGGDKRRRDEDDDDPNKRPPQKGHYVPPTKQGVALRDDLEAEELERMYSEAIEKGDGDMVVAILNHPNASVLMRVGRARFFDRRDFSGRVQYRPPDQLVGLELNKPIRPSDVTLYAQRPELRQEDRVWLLEQFLPKVEEREHRLHQVEDEEEEEEEEEDL
tara:strand:+ start:62 stop:589 length:528 start_codon:yes stop_codon:yes gene_type:complete